MKTDMVGLFVTERRFLAILGGTSLFSPVFALTPRITFPIIQADLSVTVNGLTGGTFVYSVGGATTIGPEEIPDTANQGAVTILLQGLQDGENTLSVFVRDTDGNESPVTTADIIVDTVPPDEPVITDQPASPTNNPNFTVEGEAGGTFVYSVRGATTVVDTEVPDTDETGEETIQLFDLNDGTNTVTVFVRDPAGNLSDSVSFTFELDPVPPDPPANVSSAELLGEAPDLYILTDTLVFTWDEPEPGLSYQISIDDGITWIFVGNLSSHTMSLPGPGSYSVRVQATDLAGNISAPSEPALQFDYVEAGSSTITIENPTVPTFSIANGGVTLDRSVSDVWNLAAAPGLGVTITAFAWLVNGSSIGTTQTVTLNSTDPETNLGANTLTLFVLIDGMWYSDSFVFQVVEN